MRTALMLFKDAEGVPIEKLQKLSYALTSGGINVDTAEVLPADDGAEFKNRFIYLKDTVDNVIVLASDATFDIKSVIAEVLNTENVENENALKLLGEEKNGYFALMPLEATVIPNAVGGFQGYLIEDEEFSLVVLPAEPEEFTPMCDGYVVPYYDEKYKIRRERFVFKYFGDTGLLNKTLDKAAAVCSGEMLRSVKTEYGDSLVRIVFTDEEKTSVQAAKRIMAQELGEKMYVDKNATLGETLFELLKLRNVKISVAESFTGGRVIAAIIKNSGASSYVDEGAVTYSNESKTDRLGVKEDDLRTVGAVSSKVAYEMAAGLLKKGVCDVAISTTGIAGPKSDYSAKPVGLNFIGVGMKDGVHVYRYELKGTREEITETAKNTALFLAINKLKKL